MLPAGWRPTGLYEQFRVYGYGPEQRFKLHRDGYVEGRAGERSQLSFLIYLNDGCEGDETVFRGSVVEKGRSVAQEIQVAPAAGMGLLFLHDLRHEGAPVRSGRKYVLRTDVFYRDPAADQR